MSNLYKRMENLEKEMGTLKEDVRNIKTEMLEIRESIRRLEARRYGNGGQQHGKPSYSNVNSHGREEAKEVLNREPGKLRKLKLSLFKGDYPIGWLFKAERYFDINLVSEEERMEAAAMCLEGRALIWYQYIEVRQPIQSWTKFKKEVIERFRHFQQGDAYEQLMMVEQETTMTEYREQFEALTAPLRRLQMRSKTANGTEGCGGCLDQLGIVQGIIQNHLLLVSCLVIMEKPISFNLKHLQDEKVKVLEGYRDNLTMPNCWEIFNQCLHIIIKEDLKPVPHKSESRSSMCFSEGVDENQNFQVMQCFFTLDLGKTDVGLGCACLKSSRKPMQDYTKKACLVSILHSHLEDKVKLVGVGIDGPIANNIVKTYKRGEEEEERDGPAGFGPNAEKTKWVYVVYWLPTVVCSILRAS
ncbi:1-phosphatidylinositol-3-phosphate 5-kinase [Senna tora]|uniref:glucose-6-phosphate dehydrogenase (NADP(+)) n=1 Tax=Senna tora TaxID=362788 RepID=A0A834W6T6_9FABA|nr:1-phosphatidylinositol-3-phosphate 5-kinase [Senna tora]